MIFRLILLIALVLLGLWLWRWSQSRYREEGKAFMWKGILALAAFVCLVLAAMGKLNWLAAVGAGLLAAARMMLPALIKLAPVLLGQFGPTRSQRTSTLEIHIHPSSGAMRGRVLAGPFAGCQLDQLSPAELEQLIQHCATYDPEAVPLLHAFVQRRQQQSGPAGAAQMTREEALAILGVAPSASPEEIRDAHRRLIQRMHPDRGGSEYLATRINQARDVLLG